MSILDQSQVTGSTLGSAKVTSGNQTTTSTSFVAMTGMSVAATVPSGGREVAITARIILQGSILGDGVAIALYKDGAYFDQLFFNAPGSAYNFVPEIVFYDTPTAGSHTYALYMASSISGNTVTFLNGAGSSTPFAVPPAYLIVGLI